VMGQTIKPKAKPKLFLAFSFPVVKNEAM